MLAILPLVAFAMLALGFHRKQNDWRESLVYATIPWSLFLAFTTEALTQFRFLTRTGVAWSWLGFTLLCVAWSWKARVDSRSSATTADAKAVDRSLCWDDRIALITIVAISAFVALTAVISAPNNWDAMEYHLPRVVEWMNNRGVQFYPTIDWSQLCQAPFAEYVMTHLHLLDGSDRLLALVQWFAYLGCIVGATLVSRELGGGRRAQILAAVLSATIPSAVLGASSTKNDCVAAYWIMVVAYLMLRWRRSPSWPYALAIGASMGLAVFTKGTSYAFLPAMIVVCILTWKAAEQRRFLMRLPAIAALGALVCIPLWVRNYQFSGSPLGLPYFYGVGDVNGRMFGNARISPALAAANVVRNVALNTGVPSDRINGISTRMFSAVIRSLGVDPSDRGQIVASQLGFTPRFAVRFHPLNEVLSENPVHMALFLLAGVLVVAHFRRYGSAVRWYGLGTVGAFVVYCALLRWSPWNARYQIPVFELGAAFTAVVLTQSLPRWAINSIGVLTLLMALPLALMNETRPLITRHGLSGSILTTPRDQVYFFDSHREIAGSWIAAANAARASKCRDIGIDANLLHFEYPMMALLEQDGSAPHIRYVDVENSSVRYAQPSAPPVCMVICLQCLEAKEKIAEYSEKLGKVQSFGSVVVFSQPTQ